MNMRLSLSTRLFANLIFSIASMRRRRAVVCRLLIGLGLASISVESFAFDPYEIHRIYRSPEILGRGDAGIADADDYEAIFYNPSGLARGKGLYKETVFASPSLHVSESTRDLVREVVQENNDDPQTFRRYIGKNQHLGLSNFTGIVFRRAAIGALVSTQNNVLLSKSAKERGSEVLQASTVSNQGIVFSFADGLFNDALLLGTTIKYIRHSYAFVDIGIAQANDVQDQLSDSSNYSGTGADLGMTWNPDRNDIFNLAVTVENIGDTKLSNDRAGEASTFFRQTLNFGMSLTVATKLSSLTWAMDYRDILDKVGEHTFKKLHTGLDLRVGSLMGVSGGWNQGYPCAGLFFNLYLVRFDLGGYTQEIGDSPGARPDNRYYLRIKVKI